MASLDVWGESGDGGHQRMVRVSTMGKGVCMIEVDGMRPAVLLNHRDARILADALVSLSRPEGTES
jgi:hypothetical protein